MSVLDKIIDYIGNETGVEIDSSVRETVEMQINSVFELIGYAEEAPKLITEGQSTSISQTGIDDKLIKYLEELSRLTLTPQEEEKSKQELTKILGYIDTLNELDTTDVEAMSHPFSYTNNFREDECKPSTDRELILANAPQQKDGCFKVPTTVE